MPKPHSFPKSKRVLKKQDFRKIRSKGDKLFGRFLVIEFLQSELGRLGIAASRKYGKSHERNRFKRLVREIFRQELSDLPYAIVVYPRKAALFASYNEIKEEIEILLERKNT